MHVWQPLVVITCLLSPLLCSATTCPPVKDLVRTPGEYSWFSNQSGWEGGFQSPLTARGHSTRLDHFIQASWIQLTNKADSLGYVVCDYSGNYSGEIIRFTQTATGKSRYGREVVTQKPTSVNWNCKIMPDYPSTACTCSGPIGSCTFVALD